MTEQDLHDHLRRQMSFLANSVASYDQGHIEEAVRVAVAIRVLFHDSRGSVSLLEKLGQKDAVQVITTAATLPVNLGIELDYGELLRDVTFGQEIRYNPVSPDSPTISGREWWLQPVFLRDKVPYTRRDVVLSAANKDGGAHVDDPDAKLLAMKEGFWLRVRKNPDGSKVKVPEEDVHFRMLRRLADELLCSRALRALVAR
ncbi:MAG: hypothetical protein K5880_06945 [Hydrogenophaga sp.]|uniref:hypothetical protein n=1 Tax=Hydrogenophaga sp. TaxID=1904254 RepID=UPI002616DBEA|nr:hypothetical protein [Hydrogenophaga sp.]MCV0438350.1 hypothetical protein [Hydrogenophaga sp.]